ncbi:hypothetical protein KBZ10_02265 [Streptomyces sp. F63]|nr:hypothetical protein [Streptomyces sp. F63]
MLVLPDRDTAEEAAAEAVERFGLGREPEIVREALAGEDDAEDAQWLVVIEEPAAGRDPVVLKALEALAAEYDGWLESA